MTIRRNLARVLSWFFVLGLPLLYLALTSQTVVHAFQVQGARQIALPLERENAIAIHNLEERVKSLESLNVDREVALLRASQKVLEEKLDIMVKIGLLMITGVILNLALSVFRLSVQLKTGDKSRVIEG